MQVGGQEKLEKRLSKILRIIRDVSDVLVLFACNGFQYSTPNTEPIRKALENPDDATVEASLAGEEEAFSKDETRKIAVVDPGTPEVDNMILSFSRPRRDTTIMKIIAIFINTKTTLEM
ncbi:MAG: hypothetical protein DI529_13750 [Chryseobacterium sp.]|nr:MAG: hypothetical protein DI529_13750 [Chryseobacterium sp.]